MGVLDYGEVMHCTSVENKLLSKVTELNNNVKTNNELLVAIMQRLEGDKQDNNG